MINNNLMGGGILTRRRRFMGKKDDCPYQRIEYLESYGNGGTSGQYITINSTPSESTNKVEYKLKFEFTNNTKGAIAGTQFNYNNPRTYLFYSMGVTEKQFYCGNRLPITIDLPASKIFDGSVILNEEESLFTIYGNNGEINLSTPTIGEWKQTNVPMKIFGGAVNETRIDDLACARIYRIKIYYDNVLALDFIPVRKDGIGYMYDRVTGNLFGNEGSGEFILGPDIT